MAIAFELWGQRGYPHVDIVGESHYGDAIRAVLGADFKAQGTELLAPATLTPEPGNRHDRHAVGVWIDSQLVGYLPREEAVRYSPVLTHLSVQGWAPQVTARVWGSEWEGFRGSVRLDLAEPHMLVPANLPPSMPHRLLPRGAAIQVTGEDKHLAELTPFLRPEGECWVHVTLHDIVEQTVEVRLDGSRVGQLTRRMSAELRPAVRHLAEQGHTSAARAIVKGNRIKAEVVLYVARAHQLPESFLGPAEVKAHEPIPPAPTGVRFAVPPEWPTPPEGWTPPPGWEPDPSWKPAPAGWQWWVLVWE
ncbi:HIRAN domain-containing protein [Actinoplanes sp. Pm04-4]|uniref:HIRAN domain-containing protein n=1 Tax=Paractinoplanes pyxinae TaxID=2997416 RepID=A0ABT4AVE5_9ACTN|nr:HIRAN domain-containing protein [Actinoplanes pyxinae]MCY1138215.1 HIRAN domain-containing protein [Actinoplanes pyxinae]